VLTNLANMIMKEDTDRYPACPRGLPEISHFNLSLRGEWIRWLEVLV